ncbi:hypothetical protein FRC03_004425 [Tulasnella sp. 419]|nr:hypothetical protein FRC03_004425 [Tulasnella sp. 419]
MILDYFDSTLFARPDVLDVPITFLTFNIIWTWLAAEITGNSSQVDRVWTFLPPLYSAYFALLPLLTSAPADLKEAGVSKRALIMFLIQIVWSMRLSFNTWRRGLFSLRDEDYRWAILRKHIPGVLYQIFNLGFIAIIQNILLLSLSLPVYAATIQPRGPLGLSDFLLAGVGLMTVATEFIADNQQWTYQNFKRSGNLDPNPWLGGKIKWTQEDSQRGFVAEGLWGLSRHPNFFCEQLFWLLQSLYPILAESSTPSLFQSIPSKLSSIYFKHNEITPLWPVLPAVALSTLFLGSTLFTEYVTGDKYPVYKAYQARVGMFSPVSTLLKGLWLGLTGKRTQVEEAIWPKTMKTD